MGKRERNLAKTVRLPREKKARKAATEPVPLPADVKIRWNCPECGYGFESFHREGWVYSQPACIDCLFRHGKVQHLDPLTRTFVQKDGEA